MDSDGSGGRGTAGETAAVGGSVGGQGGAASGGRSQGGQGGEPSVSCEPGFAPTAAEADGCRACEAGEYCSGESGPEECGYDYSDTSTADGYSGSWDDDLDPSTPCILWTYEGVDCGVGVRPGTATTNGSCVPAGWERAWNLEIAFEPLAVEHHSSGGVLAVGPSPWGAAMNKTQLLLADQGSGAPVWDLAIAERQEFCGLLEGPGQDVLVACQGLFEGLHVLRLSWPDGAIAWEVALPPETAPKWELLPQLHLASADELLVAATNGHVSRVALVDGQYLGAGTQWSPEGVLTDAELAVFQDAYDAEVEPVVAFTSAEQGISLEGSGFLADDTIWGMTHGYTGAAVASVNESFLWRYGLTSEELYVVYLGYMVDDFAWGPSLTFAAGTVTYDYQEVGETTEYYLQYFRPID